MKTKIGTEEAHVTPDSDTTFKVNKLKVNLQRHIVAASRLYYSLFSVFCVLVVLVSCQYLPSTSF